MRWIGCMTSIVLFGAGCQIRPTMHEIDSYIGGPPQQVNIKIGPRFAKTIDSATGTSDQIHFPTGELAKRIFTGGTDCPWTVEATSSSLYIHMVSFFPIPIWSTNARYQLACMLMGPNTMLPLSASGTGHSGLSYSKASSLAVKTALDDIVSQARLLMEKQEHVSQPVPGN